MTHPLAGLQIIHMVGGKMPVGHPVVEQHAGIAGNKRRAPAALDALQLADGVPLPVGDDETGSILLFVAGAAARRRGGGYDGAAGAGGLVSPRIAGCYGLGGLFPVNAGGPTAGVFRRQHPLQRNIYIVGVSDIGFAVGKGQLLGLHHQMYGLRRTEPHCRQIVVADDVQFLQQNMAAGIGRGFIDDMPPVFGSDGFLPARPAVVQIGHRQQAALAFAETDDGFADGAAIKGVPPLLGDDRQSAGQVGLAQDVARLQGRTGTAAGEHGPAGREFAQQRIAGDGRRQVMRYRKAVIGQGNGRRQHIG